MDKRTSRGQEEGDGKHASAFPFLSSLFASSAASTATAALTLAADAAGAPERTRRRLGMFALIASSAELFFATWIDLAWRRKGTNAPLRDTPLAPAWRFGVFGLGIAAPLVLHLVETLGGRVSSATRAAALAALTGGFILRAVMVFGGLESAQRAEDYFRWTQPENLPEVGAGLITPPHHS